MTSPGDIVALDCGVDEGQGGGAGDNDVLNTVEEEGLG